MTDNGVSIYGAKEVIDRLKSAVERYDIWKDKGAGVDIPMDRQACPEESHNASDKDLYSAQIPPDSRHDIHTEKPTQEEASFNNEAIESNSPIRIPMNLNTHADDAI